MPTKNVAIEQDRSPDWYPCLTEWLRVCKVIYNRGNNTAICFNGEKRSTGLKVLKVKSFSRTATGVYFRTDVEIGSQYVSSKRH